MNINIKRVLFFSFVLLFIIFSSFCNRESSDSDSNTNDDEITNVYYVSVKGDDNNDGSKEKPWKTITHGITTISNGEKLIILSGIYKEKIEIENKGDNDKPVYIEGESKNSTIIDGTGINRDLIFFDHCKNINISNLTIRNADRAGIRLSYSNDITIDNCIIYNNYKWGVFTDFSDRTTITNCNIYGSRDEHGIYISNSSDNAIIKNNIVHNNYAAGIQINADPSMGGDGISSDCAIDSNILYENGKGGGAAINLASVRDSKIQNNIIYNNYAGGIAAWDDAQGNQWGCKNLKIMHNTIYFKKTDGRWAISMKNGSTGGYIINNILIGGEHGGFEYNSNCLSDITIDYNIYYRADSNILIEDEDVNSYTLPEWQNKGYDKHSFIKSPTQVFIDFLKNNFHLKTDSPAIDKGLNSNLSYDFEGDNRPRGSGYDMGADEK